MVGVRFQPGAWIAKDTGESFSELEPGPQQADFDVGFGQSQEFCGFADGESFDVAKEEDQAIFFVQVGERLLQEPTHLALVDQFLGGGTPVGDVLRVGDFPAVRVRVGGLVEGNRVQAFAFTQDLEGGIGGDAIDPSGEAGFLAEIVEVFQCAEEGLLGDVLGIVFVLGDATGQGIDSALMTIGQFFKGLQIALFGALDELDVGRGRV